MSPARAPMDAPELPGYVFQRVLGSGGYSDVFLYEQQMPRRPVAIKVLLADALDEQGRREITEEANSMAAVSTHPYIVTIFHADVGSGGDPFLVMEYYPRPNFSVRARTEHLSVADVLRTGVQVASAVETAHRAGIVHRDIKPANILTSEYGRPGLTDFGIAAGLADGGSGEAAGMSVPWSPPEVVGGSGIGDATSDVYSLAATIYTLLAGRSPFEVVGGSNRTLDLLERIERTDPPPTGRGDVPASLERLLRQTMSKAPTGRPQSAAAFARALQDIEVEQQFAMTALEISDDAVVDVRARGVDQDDGTRLKFPVVIRSQAVTGPNSRQTAGRPGGNGAGSGPHPVAERTGPPHSDGTVRRSAISAEGLISGVGSGSSGLAPPAPPTPVGPPPVRSIPPAGAEPWVRPSPTGPEPFVSDRNGPGHGEPTAPRLPGSTWAVRLAAGVLILVVALAGVRLAVGGGGSTTTTTTTATVEPPPPPETTPAPTGVVVATDASGQIVVSWQLPERPQANDVFVVIPKNANGPEGGEIATSKPGATSVTLPPGSGPCVSVMTLRGNVYSAPTPTEPGAPECP